MYPEEVRPGDDVLTTVAGDVRVNTTGEGLEEGRLPVVPAADDQRDALWDPHPDERRTGRMGDRNRNAKGFRRLKRDRPIGQRPIARPALPREDGTVGDERDEPHLPQTETDRLLILDAIGKTFRFGKRSIGEHERGARDRRDGITEEGCSDPTEDPPSPSREADRQAGLDPGIGHLHRRPLQDLLSAGID